MLESLAKCLQIRGRVAAPAIAPDTFWFHGAESINLPTWWLLYLQAPSQGSNGRSHSHSGRARGVPASSIHQVLQHLIHPWQTLALIRRIECSTSRHQKAVELTRDRSRCYASLAQDMLSRSLIRAYSNQDSTPSPREGIGPAEIVSQKLEASKFQLATLLDRRDAHQHLEELWQVYTTILERSSRPSVIEMRKMLRLLHASDSQVDAERLIAVFETIDISARRSIHYSYVVAAALKLNDIDTALYFHREAMLRLHTAAGASGILRFVIGRENWDVALAVWRPTQDMLSEHPTNDDIWADSKTLPFSFLARRAVSAAEFATQDLNNGSVPSASRAKSFAVCLLKLCIAMRGIRVNITHWNAVFRALTGLHGNDGKQILNEIQCDGLDQLLSVDRLKHNEAALHTFLEICDEDHDFVARNTTWRTLFERSTRPVMASALLHLVRKWRERHGILNITDYLYALDALAEAGEIDPYSRIFQAYREDHPTDANDSISQSTLNIHQVRCDPDGVVQAFHELSEAQIYEVHIEHHNTVIRTFARAGDAVSAYDWFRKFQATGLRMNEASYIALMTVFAERGDCHVVSDLYEDASSHEVEPNEMMFSMLVHTHVKDEQLDEAQQLIEHAPEKFGKAFLTELWNRLLFGYACRLDLVALKYLHMRMQELGVPSNEMTYAALVTGLSRCRFPQNAQKIVRKIMPSLGMQAGPIHHAAVMEGYIFTRQYRRVFINYQHMLSIGQIPDMNIKNLVLKAGAGIDNPNDRDSIDEVEKFPLARRIFDEIIKDLEPSELASMDSFKYVGVERLDEAWISGYFEKMMMHYASINALSHVSDLFELYVRTAQKFSVRDVVTSPPLKILSALLVCHGRARNQEAVESCWQIVVTKCEQLSHSSGLEKGSGDAKQMLTSRQLIFNYPLKYYIDYLASTGKYQEMEHAVNKLLLDGYDLTHRNMNLYIQYLCQSPDREQKLLALRLSEQHLMGEWWGWDSMKLPYIKRFFRAMERRIRGTRLRAPQYRTLVYLAKAYIDLGFGKSNMRKPEALAALQASGEIKRTLNSIENMPKLDDEHQTDILGYRNL